MSTQGDKNGLVFKLMKASYSTNENTSVDKSIDQTLFFDYRA